jgi:hypothetical protein
MPDLGRGMIWPRYPADPGDRDSPLDDGPVSPVAQCPDCEADVLLVSLVGGGLAIIDAEPPAWAQNFDVRFLYGMVAVPWENGRKAGDQPRVVTQHQTLADLACHSLHRVHNHQSLVRAA